MTALRPAMGHPEWFETCTLVGWTWRPRGHRRAAWTVTPAGDERTRQVPDLAAIGPPRDVEDTSWCGWCGRWPLPGRRSRWCGDVCRDAFVANHFWGWARPAALKRDGWACIWCPPGEPVPRAKRRWSSRLGLEVDHIEPVEGRHALSGCHHHLHNLRTLCRAHHLERHHGSLDQLSLSVAGGGR